MKSGELVPNNIFVMALKVASSSMNMCGSGDMWHGAFRLHWRMSCTPTLDAWFVASSMSMSAKVCAAVSF